MHRCIFCEFVEGKTPCEKSYEDDIITTFLDWNHLDGIHVVAFPKKHIGLRNRDSSDYDFLRKELYDKTDEIAKAAGIRGQYRLMTEDGEDNISQNLEHLHIHVVGKADAG